MSTKIQRAKLLARLVHESQKRQDGEDYFNHCFRVAQTVGYVSGYKKENEDIICAAFLHDCIEDSPNPKTIGKIIKEIFGDEVYFMVVKLTHKNNPCFMFKDYNSYIEYVFGLSFNGFRKENPKVIKIKWADLIDNSSYKIPEKQWLKYRRACLLLREKGIEIPKILKERLHV